MRCGSLNLFILAALSFSNCLVAQDYAQTYSLEKCIAIGMERSAAAINAKRDEQISEKLIIQARSTALPHLGLSGNYTRLDELQNVDFGGESFEMGLLDNYSVMGQVKQVLFSSGKVSAALRASGLAKEFSKERRFAVEQELIRQIKRGYYSILLSRDSLQVQLETLKQYADLYQESSRKFNAGAVSEFEMLSAKARMSGARPILIAASNSLALAVDDFKKLINVTDPGFSVTGELSYAEITIDPEKIVTAVMDANPEIKAMRQVVGLKAEDIKSQKADALPVVSAFFNYNGANSYQFIAFENEWEWHWNAGVALDWNLWDGNLNAGKVAEKKLVYEKSVTELDELRSLIRLQCRKACTTFLHAGEAVSAAKEGLALAEKASSIAKSRYETGLSTYLEYTDSSVVLKISKLQLFTAMFEHMGAIADIEALSGKPIATLR